MIHRLLYHKNEMHLYFWFVELSISYCGGNSKKAEPPHRHKETPSSCAYRVQLEGVLRTGSQTRAGGEG